jgi:hypothetical protein
MRRIRNFLLALSLVGALAVAPAVVGANEEVPLHGHMLILGVEFGPEGPTYKKCIDLANNRALPLNAHHDHLHTGTAGQALFTHAGHLAVPTAPLSDIEDCAHLAELFGPPTK